MLNTEHFSSRGLKSDAVSFQLQAASACSICSQICIFQEKLCVQEDLTKSIWLALGRAACLFFFCFYFPCHESIHHFLFPVMINRIILEKSNSEALPGDRDRSDSFFFLTICIVTVQRRRLVH